MPYQNGTQSQCRSHNVKKSVIIMSENCHKTVYYIKVSDGTDIDSEYQIIFFFLLCQLTGVGAIVMIN